jgi:hypothetical protein
MIKTRNIARGDAAAETLILSGDFAVADLLLDKLFLSGVDKVEIMGLSLIHEGYTGGTTPTIQWLIRSFADSVDGMVVAGGTDNEILAAYDPESANYSFEHRNEDGTPLATIAGLAAADSADFAIGLGLKLVCIEGGTLAGGTGHAKVFARIYRKFAA